MITKRILHLSTFTPIVNFSQCRNAKSLQCQQISAFSVSKSSSVVGLNDNNVFEK